jgi:hypothetical protein
MTPETALQKAVRNRLVDSEAVTALVPVASILDRNERPNPSPSIILGEKMSRDEGESISRRLVTVWLDLHVWKKELSTAGVTEIAGAIRQAMRDRLERDPDGETSHAVVTVEATVEDRT